MRKPALMPWPGAVLAALFPWIAGCGGGAPPQNQQTPVVTVAAPVERPVTDYVDFSGKTAAVESVELRARVGGYLQKINYKEGDDVKKGQVLFEIDPRPYQAELEQAQAKVKTSQARYKQAEAAFERSARLLPSGGVSREDYEKDMRTRDVAAAAIEEAKANVAVKQLNLDFTKVLAPIDGRADKADATLGNLVSATPVSATLLTNIVRMEPMYAYFDVDELTLLRVLRLIREGRLPSPKEKAPEVLLGLGNGEDYPFRGTLDFVGNQVEASTGIISVRGVFPNKDRALAPGLFARVRLPLGGPHTALLVSDRALGTNLGQKFLYVVNDKNEVAYRPVTVGARHGGLREVVAGLKPGERVIIKGLLRVRPGVTVEPKPGEMQPEPAATGGKTAKK